MAKPENDDKKQTWGTWEELLLACAVHRHGTESWSSVSAEIQKRSPNLCSLTASTCRHKYFDLKRRFSHEIALQGSDKLESVAEISTVPWLEELRRLRVDELRRQVEQYDLSISSLQSKVKRLEEEREMSLDEPDTKIENSDLDKIVAKAELRWESDCHSGEPVSMPPVLLVKESISPDPIDNSPGTESVNVKSEEEKAGVVDGGEGKVTGEDSCRGSCESVEKESAANSERVESGRGTELTESMAESEGGANGEEEEWKETSDVQSSASLPRKGTSELDNEDQSPSAKDFPVESQPSISFVEILLSQPCGSHFSRRLETQLQETPEYGKIIRQHVDFKIIQKRVKESCYKSSTSKLFRDLLLLINNAKVFYHKGSSEFNSAEHLHQLVKKQMTTTLKRPREISPAKEKSLELVAFKDAVVAVSSKPISQKPRMSVPIIACRRRSSLAAKPLVSPSGADKKSKKTDQVFNDEKPVSGKDETSGKDDETLISKKTTRGKTSSGKRVAIRNVKNHDSSLNVDDDSKGRVSSEVKKTDEEKKGNNNSNKSGSSKKKSAASFLKRMKGGSSSDTVVEASKPSSAAGYSTTGKGGAEQKKNNSNKADAKKRAATTGGNEKGSPVKNKNNGRAIKREAAPSSSSSPILAKRSREAGEKKAASSPSSTRLKKRVRR